MSLVATMPTNIIPSMHRQCFNKAHVLAFPISSFPFPEIQQGNSCYRYKWVDSWHVGVMWVSLQPVMSLDQTCPHNNTPFGFLNNIQLLRASCSGIAVPLQCNLLLLSFVQLDCLEFVNRQYHDAVLSTSTSSLDSKVQPVSCAQQYKQP